MEVVKEECRENLFESYCSNWVWRAIECLVGSPGFNPSSKSIAERLNVPVESAIEAVEGLISLNMIKWIDGNLVKQTRDVHHGPNDMSREDILKVHSRLAPQITSALTPKDKFSTWFMLADEEIINQYTPKFVALYKSMMDEGIKKGATKIVASEISFAVMTGGLK